MSEITSFVCPASWKITTLGQICKETGGSIQTGPFGSQLHASDYVEDGIPSVMPKNISIEKILDDDIARVSVDDVNRLSKHKLQMGDIVYSRRGDVEKCVLVSEKEDGWLCGTGCIKVRIGPVGDISAKYIHAFLSHPEVRRWISQHAVGATMPNLNTSILSSVPVYLPPKELQSFIANSWFGFNQKLLVNAGINNTLENIAQAIFKSWFVDFEPTKAKIAAREALLAENPAATPEKIATAEQQAAIQAIAGAGDIIPTEQLQTIADLFPGQLVPSELGEIPEGWRVDKVENVITRLKPKQRYTKKQVEPHGNVPVFEQGAGVLLGYQNGTAGFKASPERPMFIFGDHTCVTHLSCEPFDISANVIPIEGCDFPTLWVYQAVKDLQKFQEYRRHWSEFIIKQLVTPAAELAEVYSKLATDFVKMKETNVSESSVLIQVRVSLLPKLLSGELELN